MTNREMVKDPHSVVEAASPAARVRAGPRGRPELFITAAGRMRASSEVARRKLLSGSLPTGHRQFLR